MSKCSSLCLDIESWYYFRPGCFITAKFIEELWNESTYNRKKDSKISCRVSNITRNTDVQSKDALSLVSEMVSANLNISEI